jgi:L-threonylcarbamoyladenylate synthase
MLRLTVDAPDAPGAPDIPDASDAPDAIALAVAALADGRVVAFPTDTAYGIGADPRNRAAIDQVYAIKGRPRDLPLILLAADAADFAGWAELDADVMRVVTPFWPGPLTLVVPAGDLTPAFLRARDGSIGVRIPAHATAKALLARSGPLATTSANRSGESSPRSGADVAASFAAAPAPEILLDAGPTSHPADSTVLSLMGPPRVLRAGALAASDLRAFFTLRGAPPTA